MKACPRRLGPETKVFFGFISSRLMDAQQITSTYKDNFTRYWLIKNKMQSPKGSIVPCTHTFLDKGRFTIPDGEMTAFRNVMAADVTTKSVPPVHEVRSIVFPYFADFDLKIPVADLSAEVKRLIGVIVNSEAQRFFPVSASPLLCVICDKTGCPDQITASSSAHKSSSAVAFKHGLHIHWPALLVTWDRAIHMREAMVGALNRQDWASLLGTASLDWSAFFDEHVYGASEKVGGGLRIAGAPKASPCRCAKDDIKCPECGRTGFLFDERSYQMFEALRGNEVDAETTQFLCNNFFALLSHTTVRAPEGSHPSKEWAPYAGCPVPSNLSAPSKGRKRKNESSFTSSFKNVEMSGEIQTLIRKALVHISKAYAHSTFKMFTDGKECRVTLHGEGSQYCLNISDYHKRKGVYAVIRKSQESGPCANGAVLRMKCFCRCTTQEGRKDGSCANYTSGGLANTFLFTKQQATHFFSENVGKAAKKSV